LGVEVSEQRQVLVEDTAGDRAPGSGNASRAAATSRCARERVTWTSRAAAASVFTRRRRCTRRCSATCAGFSSSTSQCCGHAVAVSSGQ